MSKVITDTELLAILARVISTNDVIEDSHTYGKFLKDIGNVVASYCGGECVCLSEPPGGDGLNNSWCLHFRHDQSVPDDGGVYASFDTDVSVEDWKQESLEKVGS